MQKPKRTRVQMKKDLLIVISQNNILGINPTRLVRKANLTLQSFKEIMTQMIEVGLVFEKIEDEPGYLRKRKLYFITQKGRDYIKDVSRYISLYQ